MNELTPSGIDEAVVTLAKAFGHLGEACRLIRNSAGIVDEVRIGGKNLVTEDTIKYEVQHRHQLTRGLDGILSLLDRLRPQEGRAESKT